MNHIWRFFSTPRLLFFGKIKKTVSSLCIYALLLLALTNPIITIEKNESESEWGKIDSPPFWHSRMCMESIKVIKYGKKHGKYSAALFFPSCLFFLLTHWEFFLRQHQLRWDVRKIWKCFAGKEVSIIWNYDNFIRRQKERKFQFDFGHKFLFSLTYFFRLYAKGLSFH